MPWIRANTSTQGAKGSAKGEAFRKWLIAKGKGKGKLEKAPCGKGETAPKLLALENSPSTPATRKGRLRRLKALKRKPSKSIQAEPVPARSGGGQRVKSTKRGLEDAENVKEEQVEEVGMC